MSTKNITITAAHQEALDLIKKHLQTYGATQKDHAEGRMNWTTCANIVGSTQRTTRGIISTF